MMHINNKPLFVTGIGTGIGKTIVSAILTEQLKADYWKPVQAGDLDKDDRSTVQHLVSNKQTIFHPEAFRLMMAASPHKAAAAEGIQIQKHDFVVPETENQLLIEGAGGLMVPLADNFLMIDLIQQLQTDVILVIRNYLGCINHSLLSFEVLKGRNMSIRKVIINGAMDMDTLRVIKKHAPTDTSFAQVPELLTLDKQRILACPPLLSSFI